MSTFPTDLWTPQGVSGASVGLSVFGGSQTFPTPAVSFHVRVDYLSLYVAAPLGIAIGGATAVVRTADGLILLGTGIGGYSLTSLGNGAAFVTSEVLFYLAPTNWPLTVDGQSVDGLGETAYASVAYSYPNSAT